MLPLTRAKMASLGSFVLYVFVSGSMVFANKAIFYTYKYDASNMLLLIQMLFTVPVLQITKMVGWTDYSDFDFAVARKVFPVTLFYCAHAVVALVSLRFLSVTAYSVVKRLTPILVLVLETTMRGLSTTRLTWASVLMLVCGSVVTATNDQDSTLTAYGIALSSCFLQAAYLIYVSKSGAETGLNATGVLFYHSLLSIPLLIPLVIVTDELSYTAEYQQFFSYGFQSSLLFLLCMGLLLNYSIFLCTETNSPLTTTIGGHVKSAGSIVGGLFTFGGVTLSPGYVTGVVLSLVGGVLYGYAKFDEQRDKERDRARAKAAKERDGYGGSASGGAGIGLPFAPSRSGSSSVGGGSGSDGSSSSTGSGVGAGQNGAGNGANGHVSIGFHSQKGDGSAVELPRLRGS